MLILDSEHVSEFIRATAAGQLLRAKLETTELETATTIVSIEEQFRGWLSEIRKQRNPHRAIAYYAKLQEILELACDWTILPWDAAAATEYERLAKLRLGIGTMDLKIASIVLANDATLLSRNLRDFERIPNLTVEDWLQ